jgi:hypothetical protein
MEVVNAWDRIKNVKGTCTLRMSEDLYYVKMSCSGTVVLKKNNFIWPYHICAFLWLSPPLKKTWPLILYKLEFISLNSDWLIIYYSPESKYFGTYTCLIIRIWIILSRKSKFYKFRIISLMHSSILPHIWLNFMTLCLGSPFFRRGRLFSFRISNFSGLSIIEETWLVEMRIWCIKIGSVLHVVLRYYFTRIFHHTKMSQVLVKGCKT